MRRLTFKELPSYAVAVSKQEKALATSGTDSSEATDDENHPLIHRKLFARTGSQAARIAECGELNCQ